MKGGIACSLAAFKALVEAGVGGCGRLGFRSDGGPRGAFRGARALLKTDTENAMQGSRAVPRRRITYQSRPPGRFCISSGRTAHAFRPHLGGINAIDDAGRIVTALERLSLREHKTFGRGTVCTLRIAGGYAEYSIVVPERCEIVITRLTVPGETRDVAVNDMRVLVDSLGLASQVDIETPSPSYDALFS